MKRLTIHLKKVEKVGNKIYNTISYLVSNEQHAVQVITKYGDNVKKHYLTNLI